MPPSSSKLDIGVVAASLVWVMSASGIRNALAGPPEPRCGPRESCQRHTRWACRTGRMSAKHLCCTGFDRICKVNSFGPACNRKGLEIQGTSLRRTNVAARRFFLARLLGALIFARIPGWRRRSAGLESRLGPVGRRRAGRTRAPERHRQGHFQVGFEDFPHAGAAGKLVGPVVVVEFARRAGRFFPARKTGIPSCSRAGGASRAWTMR